MDTAAIMKTLMNEDTLKMVGKTAGIDEKDIAGVAEAVIPMLLEGASKQNKNKDTAGAFFGAVMKHGAKDSSDMAKFIKNIDKEDGAKVAKHLVGSEGKKKAASAAKKKAKTKVEDDNIDMVISVLAPIVMNQLGQNAKKSKKKDDDALGEILGNIAKNVDADDVMKIAKAIMKK